MEDVQIVSYGEDIPYDVVVETHFERLVVGTDEAVESGKYGSLSRAQMAGGAEMGVLWVPGLVVAVTLANSLVRNAGLRRVGGSEFLTIDRRHERV
jgi:hypothetical protein